MALPSRSPTTHGDILTAAFGGSFVHHDIAVLTTQHPHMQSSRLRFVEQTLRPWWTRWIRGGAEPMSVWFVGDSTARNLFQAWSVALLEFESRQMHVFPWNMTTEDGFGNKQVDDHPLYVNRPARTVPPAAHGTAAPCRGLVLVCVSSTVPNPHLLPAARSRLAQLPPPAAVVFSVGLWTLWPVPFMHVWTTHDHFRWFEARLLACYEAVAAIHSVRQVVLLPVHPICEARMRSDTGIWGSTARAHARPARWQKSLEQCAEWIRGSEGMRHRLPIAHAARLHATYADLAPVGRPDEPLSEAGALRLCAEGAHVGSATQLLNARVHGVVARIRSAGKRRRPAVLMPNTHRLLRGRCHDNLGDDHLHFHRLVYEELEVALGHLLRPNGTDI